MLPASFVEDDFFLDIMFHKKRAKDTEDLFGTMNK